LSLDLDSSAGKVDAALVEVNGEEERSDKDENELESSCGPTIELKVALGKLDDNPVVTLLLATDDEEIEEKQNVNESMESQEGAVVSDMLTESSEKKSTKKRKVLIEELS
jgi:hypothetical protein